MTPTQIQFPLRAVLRTILQWLIGGAVAWMARVWGLDLTDLAPQIIDALTALLAVLVTAFTTWLMAQPRVAAVLAGTVIAPTPPPAPRRALPDDSFVSD